MTEIVNKYPVGIQTFQNIREGEYLYVDKTKYIVDFRKKGMKYVFLSRPRRFGKSLFASTLQSYFEGKKSLFEGLAIADYEKEWAKHPVLHLDMSGAKHFDAESLKGYLDFILLPYEKLYGKGEGEDTPNKRLMGLVERACEQTGQKVAVIIDEYDAPLLDVVHEKENLQALRFIMQNFYSPLKKLDPYLEFVFITGITKFSQLSIFSELNNLKNISMNPEFAAVCGISEEEIRTQMADYVEDYASVNGITAEEAMNELKGQYDGYHFAWPSPDIYNPFSLLNAFQDRTLNSYWFESGTPTFLIEKLREFHVSPSDITRIEVMSSAFDAPTESMRTITPLLYQSGYVTIKDYDRISRLYVLDIPNQEIRIGLMESLLPNYVDAYWETGLSTVARMYLALRMNNLDEMLRLLQAYLRTIPQCDNTNYEGHYQQLLYVIFSLMGRYVDVEVRTANGRVDMVMNSGKALCLFELKLNKSAEAAMNQINLKDYPARFALTNLPIIKIGINFDTATHTIEDWKIEK